MTLPSSTTSTAGSITLEPISPASVSTVRTSSTAAFSCLPPQRTIAYTKLSLSPLRAHGAGPQLRTVRRGAHQLVPKSWEPCPGFVLRWPFRLSDAGRRRRLSWCVPITARCRVRACRAVRRARFPGGRAAAPPAPERLCRFRAGWLARVRAAAGLSRGIFHGDAGQGDVLGGRSAVRRRSLALRGGTHLSVSALRVAHLGDAGLGAGLALGRLVPGRGGGVRASRVRGGGVEASRAVRLALALPFAVLAPLAVTGGLAAVACLAVRAAPVRVRGMFGPVEGDQQATPVAALA